MKTLLVKHNFFLCALGRMTNTPWISTTTLQLQTMWWRRTETLWVAGACQPPTVSHAIPSWFKIATSWDRNAAMRQMEKYGPLDFLPFHPLWVKIQRTDPWRGVGGGSCKTQCLSGQTDKHCLLFTHSICVCISCSKSKPKRGGVLKISPCFL